MIRKYFYTNYPRQYGLFMEIRSIVFLPIKLFFFKLGLNIYFGGKEQDSWVANEIFNQKKINLKIEKFKQIGEKNW